MEPLSSITVIAAAIVAEKIESIAAPYHEITVIEPLEGTERLIDRLEASAGMVVLIDSGLSGFDWVSAVYAISQRDPKPHVIVLGDPDPADLLSAFREGAVGFVPKAFLQDDLLPALRSVEQGRVFYRQEAAAVLQSHLLTVELRSARNVADVQDGIARLSLREKEVFPLLADGFSVRKTAETLGLSPKTIETHKYNIMRKLHLKTMADFTKLAIMKDLIPL